MINRIDTGDACNDSDGWVTGCFDSALRVSPALVSFLYSLLFKFSPFRVEVAEPSTADFERDAVFLQEQFLKFPLVFLPYLFTQLHFADPLSAWICLHSSNY